MSASPTSLLTKLDELKRWQKNQQERLMKNHFSKLEKTDNSIAAIIKENSPAFKSPPKELEVFKVDFSHARTSTISPNLETGSPLKPQIFQETLFKTLSEEEPGVKLKQPFLKRGTGLLKFGMKPGEQKHPFNKNTATCKSLLQKKKINKSKEKKGPSKLSPLKPPQVEIRPALKWQNPGDSYENNEKSDEDLPQKHEVEIISHINDLATKRTEHKNNSLENSFLMEQISRLANEKFGDNSQNMLQTTNILNQINKLVSQGDSLDLENNKDLVEYLQGLLEKCGYSETSSIKTCDSPLQSQCGDITAYERSLERDLREFERVENKIMNNSFNSTTSLLMELLQSTPRCEDKVDNLVNENCGAKKMLQFCDVQESDESSVTSDDFHEKTMNEEDEEENTNCITTSSTSSNSTNTVIKQNAAVMTDLSISQITNDEVELKTKISDLDKEVRNFRVENQKLQRMRKEVEKAKKDLEISRKHLNREMEDERIKMEYDIEEERKKLSKERIVFERYIKDQQNKMTKKEREEITNLKTELANLNETLKLKDTRNGTTQARLRNQIKTLEKENNNLKDEIEKLQKQNGKLLATQKVGRKSSEAKMLQEINKNITKLTQETGKKKCVQSEDECFQAYDVREKSAKKNVGKRKSKTIPDEDNEDKASFSDFFVPNERSRQPSESKSSKDEVDDSFIYSPSYRHERSRTKSSGDSSNDMCEKENNKNKTNFDTTAFRNLSDLSLENNYEKMFGLRDRKQRNNSLNDTQASTSSKIEKVLLDGTKEIKYPNGNIKLVSPDGNLISMKYYNGDLKETKLLDGSVKYFYSETQIWQTTCANGDEVLEFPDGQIEKKYSNGSCDVIFPNGVIKHTDVKGVEKITYPDGSIVTVNKDEKILLLPNGQKEIHTKEHKRREYPDGTVKLLYPDGLQETRYSNGRIRMKDKDGNLLMDTHGDDS